MDLNEIVGSKMIFDPEKLRSTECSFLPRFLMDNRMAITQRINETTKACLIKGRHMVPKPSFCSEPSFIAKGYGDWHTLMSKRLYGEGERGSAIRSVIPLASYLYEGYALPPSKLILGCETTTRLPVWLQNWLLQVEGLSPEETAELYSILEAPAVKADAVYVLKTRIEELAAEHGIEPQVFVLYPGFITKDRNDLQKFAQVQFRETGNTYEESIDFFGTQKLLRLIIMLCVIYQVSPEYLLLQDYSEFAVKEDGRFYLPAQRKFLSLILQASAATRAKAVGYVLATTAGKMKAGAKMPNYVSAEVKNKYGDAPVDVMAASAESDLSKNQFERSIVKLLKPKLLEILSDSAVPLSVQSLHNVVQGSYRLARKALTELEAEGKIVKTFAHGKMAWEKVNDGRSQKKQTK